MGSSGTKPYIVLIGDVGSGKSTILEKLTGTNDKSSGSDESYTEHAEVYESFDGHLLIGDTPGSNPMAAKFESNLQIAHAMNFSPVTCLLIVVKADTRIDNVIWRVREYAERFLPADFPAEMIGVCVTHMDTVQWEKPQLIRHLHGQLGIESVVTSALDTTGSTLSQELQEECKRKRPTKISVDSNLFLKVFKISSNDLKILQRVKKEVGKFIRMVEDFFELRTAYGETDQVNMTFEFQAFMHEQVIEIQHSVSNENQFTFLNQQTMAYESAHIACLTNQLCRTLSRVRIDASMYHKEYDTNFRKCPYCPAIWQKTEGCDGATTCGSRPSNKKDNWSGNMSSFNFSWDSEAEKLIIEKLDGVKHTRTTHTPEPASDITQRNKKFSISTFLQRYAGLSLLERQNRDGGMGCGATIEWSKMAPVNLHLECDADFSSTGDIPSLPSHGQKNWSAKYNEALKGLDKLVVKKAYK